MRLTSARSSAPSGSGSRTPPHDARAWDSALDTHYVGLCEYVLRLVGSAEVAEDLVHDLFLDLWKKGDGRDAICLTSAYLYTAARNRALKYLRHQRVVDGWLQRASTQQPPTAETPWEICLRHELDEAIGRAIAELPQGCRRIFLLRRRDGLGYQEIADRLGISLGTVKSQMWRAMVCLRAKLAPYLTPTT